MRLRRKLVLAALALVAIAAMVWHLWLDAVLERTLFSRLALGRAEAEAALGQVRALALTGTILGGALALAAASLGARWMARRLDRLTRAARRLAAGDLGARAAVEGDDEIAELGRAVDELASSLGAAVGELRAEHALRAGILEEMREGVLLAGEAGRIVLANPAARRMLKLPDKPVGRTLAEAVRESSLRSLLEEVRVRGEPRVDEIETVLAPRRLLVGVAPLSVEPKGLLATLVDVTELRRLEAVRRDFVANVSHELRTPIAGVRAAAETLATGALADPEASARFLDIIQRYADRLGRLVDDLLSLARIEARQTPLHIEAVTLAPLVAEQLVLVRPRAEARGMRVAGSVPEGLRVRADRHALEQILVNLLDNAVKYGAGSLAVTATATGDRVRVMVRDGGPGIAAEHLPRLFERFYRVDAGRSRELGGTGLGLAIVKHLVEAQGGHVHVESVAGQGTMFSFTLAST
jgi:two-component system phosphate regulon sensor histidine kinase PhoR